MIILRIIYASCLVSKKKNKELFENNTYTGFQVQKFHQLLCHGFAFNKCDIQILSALPVTRKNCNKIFIKKDYEKEGSIFFNYLTVINLPILKNIFIILAAMIEMFKLAKCKDNVFLMADCLNQSVSFGAVIVSKILGIKSVGIITDLPDFLSDKGKNSFNNMIIKMFNNYVLLTDEMNDYIVENITHKNKPYIVIEGSVDYTILNETTYEKYEKKVCMYTGTLAKIYGIEYLVKGFIKANVLNSELHIYGDGDFKNELIDLCKKNSNIKYFGTKPNEYIVEEQKKATLLINPRPSNEEFTKYSFPSKNLEYMASGTPLLATDLPGIPDEYKRYEYIIENENIEGIANMFRYVLNLTDAELRKKGKMAQEFVLGTKNNIIQTKKIMEWLNNL